MAVHVKILLLCLLLASTAVLAGCVDTLVDVASDVANAQCSAEEKDHAGTVYVVEPAVHTFRVIGPGAVAFAADIATHPFASASITVYDPNDEVYWALRAGVGSGGAQGTGGGSNPPIGDYVVHMEAMPMAEIALMTTVVSCA